MDEDRSSVSSDEENESINHDGDAEGDGFKGASSNEEDGPQQHASDDEGEQRDDGSDEDGGKDEQGTKKVDDGDEVDECSDDDDGTEVKTDEEMGDLAMSPIEKSPPKRPQRSSKVVKGANVTDPAPPIKGKRNAKQPVKSKQVKVEDGSLDVKSRTKRTATSAKLSSKEEKSSETGPAKKSRAAPKKKDSKTDELQPVLEAEDGSNGKPKAAAAKKNNQKVEAFANTVEPKKRGRPKKVPEVELKKTEQKEVPATGADKPQKRRPKKEMDEATQIEANTVSNFYELFSVTYLFFLLLS